jgi:hypothetical protein
VRTAAAALGLVLIIGACGGEDHYKGPGKVIETSYDDPDDWFVPPIVMPPQTHCSTGYKGTSSCYTTPGMVIPGRMEHDGPHWHVKIAGRDGHDHNLSVPQQLFDDCAVGMRWTFGEGCSLG